MKASWKIELVDLRVDNEEFRRNGMASTVPRTNAFRDGTLGE